MSANTGRVLVALLRSTSTMRLFNVAPRHVALRAPVLAPPANPPSTCQLAERVQECLSTQTQPDGLGFSSSFPHLDVDFGPPLFFFVLLTPLPTFDTIAHTQRELLCFIPPPPTTTIILDGFHCSIRLDSTRFGSTRLVLQHQASNGGIDIWHWHFGPKKKKKKIDWIWRPTNPSFNTTPPADYMYVGLLTCPVRHVQPV